jgi:hypothetical protein
MQVVGDTGSFGGDLFAAHWNDRWITDVVEEPDNTLGAYLITGSAAPGGPGWIVGISTNKRGHSRFFIDGMGCLPPS